MSAPDRVFFPIPTNNTSNTIFLLNDTYTQQPKIIKKKRTHK